MYRRRARGQYHIYKIKKLVPLLCLHGLYKMCGRSIPFLLFVVKKIGQSCRSCAYLLTYLFTCAVVPSGPGRTSLGNDRSGMSRSHQYRIRPISHLAAWSIWFALSVRYFARNVSLLSTLFTSAGIRFQSSITRMLKKFLPWSSLPCFTFKLLGSAVLLVALGPFSAFSNQAV